MHCSDHPTKTAYASEIENRLMSGQGVVLRLCSVSVVKKAQNENSVFSIARTRCQETLLSLFPIYCRLPKLDVVGSSPISRSNFSTTYKTSFNSEHRLNTIKAFYITSRLLSSWTGDCV